MILTNIANDTGNLNSDNEIDILDIILEKLWNIIKILKTIHYIVLLIVLINKS